MISISEFVRSIRFKQTLYPTTLTIVISLWFYYSGNLQQLYQVYWPEAITMVLGAFVAGSTPLGGGAVAYPMLTKLLMYTPENAQLFSILIQSVGMSCASILFIGLARKIFWLDIFIASIFSLLATTLLMPLISSVVLYAKPIFALFEVLALFVLLFNLQRIEVKNQYSKVVLLSVFAVAGGILTATIGSGADLMLFIYLVVFKKTSPILAIPSTVIFMSINALFSAATTLIYTQPDPKVISAWLAAIPIVAVAAPLGAWVIGHLNPKLVLNTILFLIITDLISTSLMGNISLEIIIITNGCLVLMFITRYWHKLSLNKFNSLMKIPNE